MTSDKDTANAVISTTKKDITTTVTSSSVITAETTGAESAEIAVSELPTETTEILTENTIEETSAEEVTELPYEQFTGILIDEDCSDFDDPPAHDLPCMLMDSCRASGYGLDIQESDGSWHFYLFDTNGQDITFNYLISTQRMDNLYVTVTGVLADNTITVINIEES